MLAWITERVLNQSNAVYAIVGRVALQGKWIALALACCAIVNHIFTKRTVEQSAG